MKKIVLSAMLGALLMTACQFNGGDWATVTLDRTEWKCTQTHLQTPPPRKTYDANYVYLQDPVVVCDQYTRIVK